ncbi:hypothetical protein L484_018218 [Morus notabilis]|uniref:4Fe-4S ferredoxin-type domain-containing protein n=1 Tax=Morus notabilis TaxID=981085 RepID=W9QFT0_9ROSA|nr:hypothetical protein L484_018218 [Morus notabilis]
MISAKLVFIIAVCLSAFSLCCAWENSGDALPSPTPCFNCTMCQYPCLSPPASGNPSYGAPPPPPPELPGLPADIPLPPPQQPWQGKCPPTPIQCCQYTPPPPYGVYVPYNHALPCSLPIFLYVIMMLLFSSAVTF